MTRLMLALAALALLAGCETGRTHHGTLSGQGELQGIQPGTDTRSSIEAQFGSPPITGFYDENIWVYLSEKKKHSSIFSPSTIGRQIAVIRFDADDTVAKLDYYTLDDGREFAFESETTATQGRQQTLLEQVFGAIGLRLDVDSSGPAY